MSAVVSFPNLLSPAGGLLVLSAYAALTLILAATILAHRDGRRPLLLLGLAMTCFA